MLNGQNPRLCVEVCKLATTCHRVGWTLAWTLFTLAFWRLYQEALTTCFKTSPYCLLCLTLSSLWRGQQLMWSTKCSVLFVLGVLNWSIRVLRCNSICCVFTISAPDLISSADYYTITRRTLCVSASVPEPPPEKKIIISWQSEMPSMQHVSAYCWLTQANPEAAHYESSSLWRLLFPLSRLVHCLAVSNMFYFK